MFTLIFCQGDIANEKITNLFQVFTFFYVFCIFCLWAAWVSLIHSVHPFWLNNCARPKGSRHVRAVLSELLILPLELYSFSHSPKSCSLFWRDQAFLLLPWSTSAACLHRLEPWSLGSLCPCSAGCRLFSCCRSPAPELIWAYGVPKRPVDFTNEYSRAVTI